MIKYQVEHYTLFDGWVNCESDGDGKKIYYDTSEEAQNSINEFVEEWNEEVNQIQAAQPILPQQPPSEQQISRPPPPAS